MKKVKFICLSMLVILIASCTENQRARQWGGTEKVKLKKTKCL